MRELDQPQGDTFPLLKAYVAALLSKDAQLARNVLSDLLARERVLSVCLPESDAAEAPRQAQKEMQVLRLRTCAPLLLSSRFPTLGVVQDYVLTKLKQLQQVWEQFYGSLKSCLHRNLKGFAMRSTAARSRTRNSRRGSSRADALVALCSRTLSHLPSPSSQLVSHSEIYTGVAQLGLFPRQLSVRRCGNRALLSFYASFRLIALWSRLRRLFVPFRAPLVL